MTRSPGRATPAVLLACAAVSVLVTSCADPVAPPVPRPPATAPTAPSPTPTSTSRDDCGAGAPIQVKFGGPLLFCNAIEVTVTADDARLDDGIGDEPGTPYVKVTFVIKNLSAEKWRAKSSTVEVYFGEARVPAPLLGDSDSDTDGGRLDNDDDLNVSVPARVKKIITRINGYEIPIDARNDIRVEVRLSDESGEVVVFKGSTL